MWLNHSDRSFVYLISFLKTLFLSLFWIDTYIYFNTFCFFIFPVSSFFTKTIQPLQRKIGRSCIFFICLLCYTVETCSFICQPHIKLHVSTYTQLFYPECDTLYISLYQFILKKHTHTTPRAQKHTKKRKKKNFFFCKKESNRTSLIYNIYIHVDSPNLNLRNHHVDSPNL